MLRNGLVCCPLVLLAACAGTPDVTVQYYPAKSVTTFTTTQNLSCTKDEMTLVVTNTVSAATEYAADTAEPPHSIRIKDLGNAFADSTMSVELFGDGRLKSINATSTGQGQAIVSAAVQLAKALPLAMSSSPSAPHKLAACAVLKNWSDGKAALTFVKPADLARLSPGTGLRLNDDEAALSDPALYAQIASALPEITADVSEISAVPRPASYNPAVGRSDVINLTLHDTRVVQLDFYALSGGSFSGRHWLGAKTFTVPGPDDYSLPIPKAALFGGEQFSLALSESGAVTSLSYGRTSGVPAALGAATSAVTIVAPAPPVSP